MVLEDEARIVVCDSTLEQAGNLSSDKDPKSGDIVNTPSREYLYLTVFVGNLLALTVGFSVTWSSPVLPKLLNGTLSDNPLAEAITNSQASWIGALYAVGGIFGPIISGYVLSSYGRKSCALLCGGIPFVISFYAIAFSKTVILYYVGRFLIGIAASSIYTVMPLYNAEISEVSIRGKICSSISTFETTGELLTYLMGPFLSVFWYCFVLGTFALIATILAAIVLPESPQYLVEKGQYVKARESLMKLRSDTAEGVKDELELILKMHEDSKTSRQASIREIFKSVALRRAQLMILGLLTFQITSGIITILFYSQTIFKETGSKLSPEISAMSIGITEWIASFITPNFVDRCGRKPLLIISASGMLVSNFHLGLYFLLKFLGYDLSSFFWLPIVCLVVYIFSYLMGFGPMLWTMMGEVFPPEVKSAATSLTCFIYWTLIFVMSKTFDLLTDPLSIAVCFLVYAACCAISIVYVLTYVIETKGKNFQEIQEMLSGTCENETTKM